MSSNIELKSPLPALAQSVRKVRPYVGVLVFMLFAGVYGYMVFQINSLADPTVEQSSVQAEAKALPVPRIDDQAAKQLMTLKDNSVNVQTFFEQGRTNPFE